MAGEFFRDGIHVSAGVGLGVDIAGEIVDVKCPLTHRFVLLPELFLFLLDLFLLRWRPLGPVGLRSIGLLRCAHQQSRDEWDREHRVLLARFGCVVRWTGTGKWLPV